MISGLAHMLNQIDGVVEGCCLGEQHCERFPKTRAQRATKGIQLINSIIVGMNET